MKMWKILATVILISSTCCFGFPTNRPQYEIDGIVDIYINDQNIAVNSNSQRTNGNIYCSGRTCKLSVHQGHQPQYPNAFHSIKPTPSEDMIIVLVSDDQNTIHHPNTFPGHQPGFNPFHPYPLLPSHPPSLSPFLYPPHISHGNQFNPHNPKPWHHGPTGLPPFNQFPNHEFNYPTTTQPTHGNQLRPLTPSQRPNFPNNNNNNNDNFVPVPPQNNQEEKPAASNCPFGNFFCHEFPTNSKPTETSPTQSPIDSIPTTTSIDDLISNVFKTDKDSEKPTFNIDVRMDS